MSKHTPGPISREDIGGYIVETWIDRPVLQRSDTRDERIGRVVLARGITPDGRESWQEHSYWYQYGAPDVPMARMTTRDFTVEQARAAIARAEGRG
jgi:hypothetical protein